MDICHAGRTFNAKICREDDISTPKQDVVNLKIDLTTQRSENRTMHISKTAVVYLGTPHLEVEILKFAKLNFFWVYAQEQGVIGIYPRSTNA